MEAARLGSSSDSSAGWVVTMTLAELVGDVAEKRQIHDDAKAVVDARQLYFEEEVKATFGVSIRKTKESLGLGYLTETVRQAVIARDLSVVLWNE